MRSFLTNLGLLLFIGIALFLLFPEVMRGVLQIYNGLFGPVLIVLILVVAALPGRRRRR